MVPQQSRCLRFHHDFDGIAAGVVATDGQSGSGISPPTVSCPFAPANMMGSSCLPRSPALEPPSISPPNALVAADATNSGPISSRNEDFIVTSCN
jgi:hypothetical protein